jgi:hypothetical protein
MKSKKELRTKGKKKLPWIAPKRTQIQKEISRVVAATTMY